MNVFLERARSISKNTLAVILCCIAVTAIGRPAAAQSRHATADPAVNTTSSQPPRKVIVGTVVQPLWGDYPSLPKRLDQLTAMVDRMAEVSRKKYSRDLDLAVLPEMAVTGGLKGDILAQSFPFEGAVQEAFARKAREHRCYIVVPMYLVEDKQKAICTNAGILIGRSGEVLGTSPQTSQLAFRAKRGRYYIVSSTWRDNASIFEPTGKITAQVRPPGDILVQELDLSYALLPWSGRLGEGAALRKKYGDKVGFRYYRDEDVGIFWSNNPQMPIRRMIQSIGVAEEEEELDRIRKLYRKAGVPGP
jgi:hypothetical protein